MKTVISMPTGLGGTALVTYSLPTAISNVLGISTLTQRRAGRVPSSEMLTSLFTHLDYAAGEVKTNKLLALSNTKKDSTERQNLRDLIAKMFTPPRLEQDMSEWFLKELERSDAGAWEANDELWTPLWQRPQRQLFFKRSFSTGVAERPHWSMKVESPFSEASRSIARWVAHRDSPILGVHLVPPQAGKRDGFDYKMKQLEDVLFDADAAEMIGAYGSLLLYQLPMMEMELRASYYRWAVKQGPARLVARLKQAVGTMDEAMKELRAKVPSPQQIMYLRNGFQKNLTARTEDGDLEAVLLTYLNGRGDTASSSATSAAEKIRGLKSNGSTDAGLHSLYDELIAETMSPKLPSWGDPSKVFSPVGLLAMLSEISPWVERWSSIASSLGWGSVDAAPSGFVQAGADFSLSDMDGWEGNLANAVLGLTPLIGTNNPKLLGRAKKSREDWGIGDKAITTYVVPVDAPTSTAHPDHTRRRFMPLSSVAETSGYVQMNIAGAAQQALKRVEYLWNNEPGPSGADPTGLRFLRNDYTDPEEKTDPTGVVVKIDGLKTTDWDPTIRGAFSKVCQGVGEAYPSGTPLSFVAFRESGFALRIPVSLARSTVIQIADDSGNIVRTYKQLGDIQFSADDGFSFSTQGGEAVNSLARMMPDGLDAINRTVAELGG